MFLLPVPPVSILQPTTVERTIQSGRTHPIEMSCSNDSNHPSLPYIVKPWNDLPLRQHTCARELFGALLGIIFGLTIPQPVIIYISSDFPNCIYDSELKNRLQNSQGNNFGSTRIQTGAFPFMNVPNNLIPQALQVFAFDALIQNSDRRSENPNMFQTPTGYILFDHELAFPFSRPADTFNFTQDAWELTSGPNLFVLRNHAMYKFLKHETVILEEFESRLGELNAEILDIIVQRLPPEWRTIELDNICAYLLRAASNAHRFKRSLQEVLA